MPLPIIFISIFEDVDSFANLFIFSELSMIGLTITIYFFASPVHQAILRVPNV